MLSPIAHSTVASPVTGQTGQNDGAYTVRAGQLDGRCGMSARSRGSATRGGVGVGVNGHVIRPMLSAGS